MRSQTGRDWMAIRDMDTAAAVAGIRVNRSKVLAFAVSAFYGRGWRAVGLCLPRLGGCAELRPGALLPVLFIIIIGGLGSIGGSFIGAAFISLLPLGLDFVSQSLFAGRLDAGLLQNIQKVIFGVLIIGFLIKEPEGIARLLHNWRARLSVWPLRF